MDCDLRKGGGDSPPRLPEYVAKERYCLFPCGYHGKAADKDALELTLCPPGENRGCRGCCHPSSSYLQFNPGNKTSATDKVPFRAACRHPHAAEQKGAYFAPPPPQPKTSAQDNPSQKRSAAAAVVGWPPVQSFRKNLASADNTKQSAPETRNLVSDKAVDGEKLTGIPPKGMFVKINLEGVPIGRKVDLRSCESYDKLATTVDKLFRDLLSAQSDSSIVESPKPITGLLDGTGEYTLVYEDHEGDRVLIGDVPWNMFVATARRLHVLKRSNLSITNRESCNRQCA